MCVLVGQGCSTFYIFFLSTFYIYGIKLIFPNDGDLGHFVYENEHFLAFLENFLDSSGNRADKLSVQKQMVRVIQRYGGNI